MNFGQIAQSWLYSITQEPYTALAGCEEVFQKDGDIKVGGKKNKLKE